MFGDEGLAETGLGVSFLAPASWFSELSLQALQPKNTTVFVESHHSLAYVLKWKNLWDLSDATTIEWGLSGLSFSTHAHDSSNEEGTGMYGTDLTLKWRPTKDSKSTSFMWSTEFIYKDKRFGDTNDTDGLTSFVRYQLKQRWFLQAQYESFNDQVNDANDINGYSFLVAYIPTEFSSIRAQYDSYDDGQAKRDRRFLLQLNISIGAHPAHTY